MRRILLFSLAALAITVTARPVPAATQISIRLGDSPVYFPARPSFVVVPGTRVYWMENDLGDYDVYRYGNTYYVMDGGVWYRSSGFRGPFVVVGPRYVPRTIITAVDYRSQGRVHARHGKHRGWREGNRRY